MTQHLRHRRLIRFGMVVVALVAVLLVGATLVRGVGLAHAAPAAPRRATTAQHSDHFQVTFQTEQFTINCPPNTDFNTCLSFTGTGNASILGATTLSRTALGVFSPTKDCIPFVSDGSLTAKGGAINFIAVGHYCFSVDQAHYLYQFIGGTGKFAHATGTGTIFVPFTGQFEPETWSGTLDVN